MSLTKPTNQTSGLGLEFRVGSGVGTTAVDMSMWVRAYPAFSVCTGGKSRGIALFPRDYPLLVGLPEGLPMQRGLPVGLPMGSHGIAHGILWDFPWDRVGIPMGFPMGSRGTYHGIAWELPWDLMGYPMEISVGVAHGIHN